MEKILVVLKKSAYELYSNSNDPIKKAHIDRESDDARLKIESHERQQKSIDTILMALDKSNLLYETREIEELDKINDRPYVIVCGGDGTVLEVARHIYDSTPILGVNTDTVLSKGFFCISDASRFEKDLYSIESILKNRLLRINVYLDNLRVGSPALNDIVFYSNPPSETFRGRLTVDKNVRDIYGGGLLVSTPAGSTASMWENNGIVLPLDDDHMEYVYMGRRSRPNGLAREIEFQSLNPRGKAYIDGKKSIIEYSLDNKILLKLGDPVILLGDLEPKRKEYLS